MKRHPAVLVLLAPLALPLLLGLPGCAADPAPRQEAVQYGQLPAIAPTYKAQIQAWAKGFYADPRALASSRISDPMLIRDNTGRLLWLVCVRADDRARPGPEVQAFGFAPNYFSAPLERRGSSLTSDDCGRYGPTYRPFPRFAGR